MKRLISSSAYQHSVSYFCLAIALMAAGCSWDTDLHNKYIGTNGPVTCNGYCKSANIQSKESCDGTGMVWNDAYCEIDGKQIENIATKESCETYKDAEGKTGTWIKEHCELTNKEACEKNGQWVTLDYQILDVGNGQYIRKFNGKYLCGSFDEILSATDSSSECTDKDMIEDLKESIKSKFCPVSSNECIDIQGIINLDGIGICSSCPINQVKCVDSTNTARCYDILNNPEHCGKCQNACKDGKLCIEGKCVQMQTCSKNEIKCYCNDDKTNCSDTEFQDSSLICFSSYDKPFCGAKKCEDLPKTTACETDYYCKINESGKKECVQMQECSNKNESFFCYCDKDNTNECRTQIESSMNQATCIQSADPNTCGAETCKNLGHKCNEYQTCVYDNETKKYACKCGEKFVGYVLQDGSIECLDPTDPKTCAASPTSEGTSCRVDQICNDGCKPACPNPNTKTCFCNYNQDNTPTDCSDTKDEISNKSIVCLNPSEPGTCGVTTCEALNSIQDSQKCPESLICKLDGSTYQCVCPENLVLFNGKCLNPYSNDSCGVKDSDTELTVCQMTGQVCDGKQCKCLQSTVSCSNDSDECIDLLTDRNHCGSCDNACNDDEECSDGICRCPEGLTHCFSSGKCQPVINDKNHCGAKGECNEESPASDDYKGVVCNDNQVCNIDTCECAGSTVKCGDKCINPNTDDEYCGLKDDDVINGDCSASKTADNCTEYEGGAKCIAGKCVCSDGKIIKKGQKICTDPKTDPTCCTNDCKDCGDKVCTNGGCSAECDPGLINCGGHCLTQTDAHIMLSNDDKTKCVCLNDEHSEWCDDNDNPNDGCFGYRVGEKGSDNIVHNCPQCGIDCLPGYDACNQKSSGAECGCSLERKACKYIDDDKNEYVICTDLNSEELHMTECGQCASNWGNLNKDWHDGCEADLSSNVKHCGTEGNDCTQSVSNVNKNLIACEEGKCSYQTCMPGFDDCDGNIANGCETDVNENSKNCGTCGNACREFQKCMTNGETGTQPTCCYENGLGCESCSDIKKTDCCGGLKLYKRWCPFHYDYKCANTEPETQWYCRPWKEQE